MNSPIILVVAWFLINLVLKSSKEKKKIEEARRRRENQLGAGTTDAKRTVDTSRETLKKELQMAMASKTNRPSQPKAAEKPTQLVRPTREVMKPREPMNWRIREEESLEKAKSISEPMRGNRLKIDFKKDLVRGIIFSEILSPPESLKNQKRSI